MKYKVEGRITFTVELDNVDANSGDEAIQIAKKHMREYYHLNSEEANHTPEHVAIDLWLVDNKD